MKNICVCLNDPANLRLLPVIEAIDEHPDLTLQIVVSGSMLLRRYGAAADSLPFPINERIHCEVWGDAGEVKAMSAARAMDGYAGAFARLQPDAVVIIGDRFETLGTASAAHLCGVPIVHFQGGEVSGTQDDATRRAITQLATWHVPATIQARLNVVSQREMGIQQGAFLGVGCPGADLADAIGSRAALINYANNSGSGAELIERFGLLVFHPDTDATEDENLANLREAYSYARYQPYAVLMRWPNIDAGSDACTKFIRQHCSESKFRIVRYLPPELHMAAIAHAEYCVGNSSAFVRDSGWFGTPVSLVGNRQHGREHGSNVAQFPQIGTREKNDIYGKPGISREVVAELAKRLGVTDDAHLVCN